MEAKYKDGEIVIERVRPGSKMIVIRRQDGLYYCKTIGEEPENHSPTWSVI